MVHRLPRHPEPPVNWAERPLPLVSHKSSLWRIHSKRRDALFFGKTGDFRFDDPAHEFGVLYTSVSWFGAFVETAGHRTGRGLITDAWRVQRVLCEIIPSRVLRLVDLRGRGLARLGVDARLVTGEHALAQRWSRALWLHPSKPDGICYPCRHDPSQSAVALYDRARRALKVCPVGTLSDRKMDARLSDALDRYGFGLIAD